MDETSVEALVRRDRVVTGSALAALTILSWAYLLLESRSMRDMGAMSMDMPAMSGMSGMGSMSAMSMAMPFVDSWSWVDVGALTLMWSVMMVAMMTGSAAPMVLTFASVRRRRESSGQQAVPTSLFVGGYLLVWTAFSAAAATIQGGLHAAALLSPAMASVSPALAGGLLLGAGIFQWTPLKRACLSACRSPLSFLMSRWREGRWGALSMGARHGAYCVGCCWALMALLFVAGVMNLLWVAALSVIVLVEKVLPRGDLFGRAAGMALAAVGVLFLVGVLG